MQVTTGIGDEVPEQAEADVAVAPLPVEVPGAETAPVVGDHELDAVAVRMGRKLPPAVLPRRWPKQVSRPSGPPMQGPESLKTAAHAPGETR